MQDGGQAAATVAGYLTHGGVVARTAPAKRLDLLVALLDEFTAVAGTHLFGRLGLRRSLTLPGVSATVAEEIEALRKVGGDKAVALIRREPDDAVARIIETWPEAFATDRAHALGFTADASFDAIVADHVAEFHAGV